MLGESGRRGLAELARQSLGDMHTLALNVRPCVSPALKRYGVFGEVDADFLKHRLGVGFDDLQRFLVEDFKIGNIAFDIFRNFETDRRALCPSGRAPAFAPSCHPRDLLHRLNRDQASLTVARGTGELRLLPQETDIRVHSWVLVVLHPTACLNTQRI